MKTFVANDYQVTLMDNGGVIVLIDECSLNKYIKYDPDDKKHWSTYGYKGYNLKKSNRIIDLDLSKWKLEILREAFALVNKQDLFDNEIVFVNKEEK